MYDLLITEAATQDLDGIVEYIAVQLSNPSAACAFVDSVQERYEVLRATPMAYAECSDKHLQAKKYRKAVINNFLMVYRVDEQKRNVYILRFFYGGQDYVRQL